MNPLWPTIVAVSIFLLIAVVMLAAMRRYTFEQAMKIWQAEVGLLGTIIGMVGTFFFAQVSISNLSAARDTAQRQAQLALVTTGELEQARKQIADKLAERIDELDIAKQEAAGFRDRLARAEKKWESFGTHLAEPEFRKAIFTAYTTTGPPIPDITVILNEFSGQDTHPDG